MLPMQKLCSILEDGCCHDIFNTKRPPSQFETLIIEYNSNAQRM